MNTLVSEVTIRDVDRYIKEKWPVLVIAGSQGSDKDALVQEIIPKILGQPQLKAGNVHTCDSNGSTISIDEIRNIKSFLKLRNAAKRIVYIRDADRMGVEAQNALLKSLEETAADVLFILTTSSKQKLLQTVLSRSQIIEIVVPTLKEAMQFYDNFTLAEVEKAYHMSNGRPRYLREILEGEETEIVEAFAEAKILITQPTYERLLQVDRLSKDEKLGLYLFALQRITKHLIMHGPSKKQEKLIETLKHIHLCETEKDRSNPNRKLMLTNLLLHM